MVSREPVRSESHSLIDWLLDSKLAPSFIASGENMGGGVVRPKSETRLGFEALRDFGIEVIADVVILILYRNVQVITQQKRPSILVVGSPFNGRRWRSLRWPRAGDAVQVHTDLNLMTDAGDDGGRIRASARVR